MTRYEVDGYAVTFTDYGRKRAMSVTKTGCGVVLHAGDTPMEDSLDSAMEAVRLYKEVAERLFEDDAE